MSSTITANAPNFVNVAAPVRPLDEVAPVSGSSAIAVEGPANGLAAYLNQAQGDVQRIRSAASPKKDINDPAWRAKAAEAVRQAIHRRGSVPFPLPDGGTIPLTITRLNKIQSEDNTWEAGKQPFKGEKQVYALEVGGKNLTVTARTDQDMAGAIGLLVGCFATGLTHATDVDIQGDSKSYCFVS